MDLDSYIARYTGENRMRRLLSITASGPDCLDLAQRQRALQLAERQMRRDRNALLYKEVFGEGEIRKRVAIQDPIFDRKWNGTKNCNGFVSNLKVCGATCASGYAMRLKRFDFLLAFCFLLLLRLCCALCF